MDDKNSILNLIEIIKQELEYDKDVKALAILLSKLLDFSEEESIDNWYKIIMSLNTWEASLDMDLTPLIHDYPIELIDKLGLERFFTYVERLPLLKKTVIYRSIFNIFKKDDYFYNFLEEMVIAHDLDEEKRIIELIINKSHSFSEEVFTKEEFIRQIVLLHIHYEFISSDLFKYLLTFIKNKKEQAVLKTLVIDYLT